MKYNVIVIGGGPAGLGAAVEAKKNGAEKILIVERGGFMDAVSLKVLLIGIGESVKEAQDAMRRDETQDFFSYFERESIRASSSAFIS